jgi:hypothetical protein
MRVLVQFDFPFEGPFGKEMAGALKDLAASISSEPGLLWKIWTENPSTREAGGIYLFTDQPSAERYIEKHTARLQQFGVTKVNAKLFVVNPELTHITRGPLG